MITIPRILTNNIYVRNNSEGELHFKPDEASTLQG